MWQEAIEMKRYLVAAGALLMSSSTLALAADLKVTGTNEADAAKMATEAKATSDDMVVADVKATEPILAASLVAAKSDFASTGDAKLDFASLDQNLEKMAASEGSAKTAFASAHTDTKIQAASLDADTKFQTASLDGGAKFQTASLDSKGKFDTALSGDAKLQTASVDNFDKLEVPSADARAQFATAGDSEAKLASASGESDDLQLVTAEKSEAHVGMGGPLEADLAGASLAPQPATQDYPACSPGPGDDRCIQLYEDGVREQLASWNRPTGGLLDDQAGTAMGGPYEPVATEQSKPLVAADAGADTGTKPVQTEADPATDDSGAISASKEAPAENGGIAHHSDDQGVGGPVEAQSGYPPCSDAGPGEDRCIQLYEAGVSGAGN
jgi:hypothetical protein